MDMGRETKGGDEVGWGGVGYVRVERVGVIFEDLVGSLIASPTQHRSAKNKNKNKLSGWAW